MSHCSNSGGKSLTSRGLQSGLMVSILVAFPLPPSSVAHNLVGGAAPCSRSLHAAGAKASGCHERAAVPGWHRRISWRNHQQLGGAGRSLVACSVAASPRSELRQGWLCTRGLFSGMGCSCLGSGQNGGIGFEKETCLLFFKQQKGKLKDWDLPSRFSLRH